jgi:hypothetical protein
MAIHIDSRTIDDLRWYFDEEYKGEMGYGSAQGRVEDALVRGSVVNSIATRYSISPRAMAAAQRLRLLKGRLERLTTDQATVLSLAFKTRATRGDIMAFGDYPYVSLFSPKTLQTFQKEQPSQPPAHMEAWLTSLAYSARHAKTALTRASYASLVDSIREDSERMLADALSVYGASVTVKAPPLSLSLRALASRLHSDPRTIRKELASRGVQLDSQKGRKGASIPVALLKEAWPEIAPQLG